MNRAPVTTGRPWRAHAIAFTTFVCAIGAVLTNAVGGRSAPIVEIIDGVSFIVGFAVVGWLLASRVPGNPIGWSFSVGGLLFASTGVLETWINAAYGDDIAAMPPFARAALVLTVFSWALAMPFCVTLPLLLLPDGTLLSNRWRFVVLCLIVGSLLAYIGFAMSPGEFDDVTYPGVVNPMGIRALGPLPIVMAITGAVLLALGSLAGAVSAVLRFRRSRGIERQQMRWVAVGGCTLIALAFGLNIVALPGVPKIVSSVGSTLGILAVPVCVAIAVLRYRLYDLGRLVSRTLSFAIVSALLLGVYLVLVTLTLRVLPAQSNVAVAGSTLAAAALFQPLRKRVQSSVEKRFNRARYDAELTVAAFSRRLRHEVELDVVRGDLVTVVQQALEPTRVSLWLRASA